MIDPLSTDIFRQGQVLNNTYEIEGVLGRGGTGEVYRARNQISGRVVAIKALNAQFSGNADYIELMKREEEMRNILHDAVVRYTECSRTDGGAVILVMDYIDGPSLNDVMLSRRADPRELLIVAHRVAEGLVATHRHGIVHRDLSPDNIILRGGQADKATIIDFGIAKDTAAGARTIVGNEFAGKYEYAAPEQLEGRADARTDLYSLGATLLAAFRGEIPFPGATPGEIVRRKQQPLDSQGVPQPLKDLIDWLTEPDPAKRPQDAEAVVSRLEEMLKPPGGRSGGRAGGRAERPGRGRTEPASKSGGGGLKWAAALVVLAGAAGGGAWYAGLLDPLFVEPLPVAAPYAMAASFEPGGAPSLSFNAPDVETATRLETAYAETTGMDAPEGAAVLATGMPSEAWPTLAAGLIREMKPLESWDLRLEDLTARVQGLASDGEARERLTAALRDWGAANGIAVQAALKAGPMRLPASDVAAILQAHETCGPLSQAAEPGAVYAMGEQIVVTGDLAGAADAEALKEALERAAGDRTVTVDTRFLNDDLCAIRAVLPATPPSALSISLSDGDTGQPNLTGVYVTGQNPVVDVQAPDGADGNLWVFLVDNDGKVYNVLPNINQPAHRLSEIGTVEGGIRRVRVLWSVDEFRQDPTRMAFKIENKDYGKSEIIAILTRTELFDMRRPRDESVASMAEALSEAVAGREDEILGVASRIIDARP